MVSSILKTTLLVDRNIMGDKRGNNQATNSVIVSPEYKHKSGSYRAVNLLTNSMLCDHIP